MRQAAIFSAFALCSLFSASGQLMTSFRTATSDLPSPLRSNSASNILVKADTIWIGSSRGLSFTADAGRTWRNLANTATFDEKGVSALAIRGNEVWAATSSSRKFENDFLLVGGGLHYSTDRGQTWTFVGQPVDTGRVDTLLYGKNKIPALAITALEQNVTFDIALTQSSVWIASWAGMLRRSDDFGKSWKRIVLPPDDLNHISPFDSLKFNLSNSQGSLNLGENLNHLVFAVHTSSDSTIWVGTAGGINKSVDGGSSWQKFNHQNQPKPICGNYVGAIREQRSLGRTIIWAICNNAFDPDEKRGVSYTEDGGESWKTILFNDFTRDVAFKDSVAYIASDGGLYRTDDFGETLIRAGTIHDPVSGQRFTEAQVVTVDIKGDTVWIGGPEGVAYTIDSAAESFGKTWKIFRTYQPVQSTAKTYSYPLPFSPDDEVVRLHYSTRGRTTAVTIRIFDFAMQPVKTLIRYATRSATVEHDEIWSGKDDLDRRVANGVYFYRVEVEGNEPIWGKIFVLQ